jgi:hypothetical protein
VPPVASIPQTAIAIATIAAAAPKPDTFATPVVLDEPIAFNVDVDISFAEMAAPKQPDPPIVTTRANVPIRASVSKFVEPPIVNERIVPVLTQRAGVVIPKPAAAAVPAAPVVVAAPIARATPPAPTTTIELAVPPVVELELVLEPAPVAALAVPAPPVAMKPVAAPAPKQAVAVAPVLTAAPTKAPPSATAKAPPPAAAAAPVKKPGSIWSSLPVAPRAPVAKPNTPAAKPSMSVSVPLLRRPAAAAPAKSAPAAKAPVAPNAATSGAKHPVAPVAGPTAAAAPASKPAAKPAAGKREDRPESLAHLESTQTMRALTSVELEDHNVLPWFVIELATSKEAFDPDTVPNLDIFAEYKLYCVTEVGKQDIVHSLRVGFFSAEIAAKAVASYLAEYYDKPSVKRVSLAERERFAEETVEARKDVGATGRHSVIEITDDLVARRQRIAGQNNSPP